MPDELYRIQDLCLRKDNTMLIDHLTMYQYKGEIIGLIGLHERLCFPLSCPVRSFRTAADSTMRSLLFPVRFWPPTLLWCKGAAP